MTKIQKSSKKQEKKVTDIEISGTDPFVGQIFIETSYDTSICRITEVEKKKDGTIYYEEWGGNAWDGRGGRCTKEEFQEKHADHIINKPIEEFLAEVNEIIEGKRSLANYQDNQDISRETALVQVKSTDHLNLLRSSMDEKRKIVEVLSLGVRFEMEKRKDELDKIRRSLDVIVDEFREKIRQIEKVIYTIELYLGIKEDIVQIQQGTPCSGTIHFWQKTLFMDEEVGDPLDDMKGLDYSNIKEFDAWLLKYSKFYGKYNYELLIPQNKGLICLRIRRKDKNYGGDGSYYSRMRNEEQNEENRKTYILIRNGTDIYRIWGNIKIYPKLFPDQEELQNLKDEWDTLEEILDRQDENLLTDGTFDDEDDSEDSKDFFEDEFGDKVRYSNLSEKDIEKKKKEINNELFMYKQYFIMLQGLIDRTEVFYPIPETISLMSTECHEKGLVKFVYDDTKRLTDGKPSFADWQKKLNESISEGSRIIWVRNAFHESDRHSIGDRYDNRYANHYNRSTCREDTWNLPEGPKTDIYQVRIYSTPEWREVDAVANSKSEIPEYEFKRYGKDGQKRFDDPAMFPYTYHTQNKDGYNIKEKIIAKYLAIYYNPGGIVRNNWDYWDDGHERKKGISYKIFKDDRNILNYDDIDLEDVEYYLYDRRHRHEYLVMMPVLWKIKQTRESEIKDELAFVKGLIQDMQKHNQKITDPKKAIWDAIEWWKLKNKWKRPISKDDSKAWRMIKKRLGLPK